MFNIKRFRSFERYMTERAEACGWDLVDQPRGAEAMDDIEKFMTCILVLSKGLTESFEFVREAALHERSVQKEAAHELLMCNNNFVAPVTSLAMNSDRFDKNLYVLLTAWHVALTAIVSIAGYDTNEMEPLVRALARRADVQDVLSMRVPESIDRMEEAIAAL